MRKPTLFVGSSSESRDLAYAVQEHLQEHVDVTVWDQGIFEISKFSLDSLRDAIGRFEYGLFIFAPDDDISIRGEKQVAVRDNVLLELGLCIGRLGLARSFILMPQGPTGVRLPGDLLGVTVATYDWNKAQREPLPALGPACSKLWRKIRDTVEDIDNRTPDWTTRPASRREFTRLLLERLDKKVVKTLRLVTYTGEVDVGLLNRFHVTGTQTIEVYKRSILADLAEQQECNMKRIAAGATARPWSKRVTSVSASERLERELPAGTTLKQYLYISPPTRRAYIFDEDRAVIAYYEVRDDINDDGSIYKGMVEARAMVATRADPVGNYLLDETEHHLKSLKRFSRTWEEERSILKERSAWRGFGPRPCIEPRSVFLDLDGVLYDSLPLYVTAWKEAFGEAGIDFPEREVYLQEGRRGKETINTYLRKIDASPTDDLVNAIHRKKREVLERLGRAPIQVAANDLVRAIAASGLDIWVVTGASRPGIAEQLQEDFANFISANKVITGRDVRAGKPDADPYVLACFRCGIHPHEGIAIENSPLGIKAADSAGLFCIGVNTGILSDEELEEAGARAIFSSCQALADRWKDVVAVLRA